MRRRLLKKVQIVSLAAGLALFAYLINETGFETLTMHLLMMGWGVGLVLGLSALRNCVRAGSWYAAIEPGRRTVGYLKIMNVMLAGEAIKYLTATGPFLGEPAKAAMVRRQVPLLQGLSSVVVENLIYYLSVMIFLVAGIPALLWMVEVPEGIRTAGYLLGVLVVLLVLLAWMAVRGRWYFAGNAIAYLAGRRNFPMSARLKSATGPLRSLEESVYSFYERRPGAFYLILAFNLAAHLINIIEVYVILDLMGLPATLSAGFVIEAVTKLINLAFFFVPTRAGVYESGNALVFSALGMSAGAGVALAIVRKLRAFVWVAYGLVAIAVITARDNRTLQRQAVSASTDEAVDPAASG